MPINFKDPFAQATLQQWLTKQYGGWSQQAQDIYNNILSGTQDSGSVLSDPKILSDQSGLLNRLKGISETGMENLNLYRQNAQAQIGRQYNKSATGLRESLAQSGLLRSGIGASAQMGLDASRMQAFGDVEEQLMRQNEATKMNALNAALGYGIDLDKMRLQVALQERGLDQNALLSLLGLSQTTDTAALQDERNKSPLGGILGGIGGSFLGGLGGALGSSLGKK